MSGFLAQIDPGLMAWAGGVSLCVAVFKVTTAQREELRDEGRVRTHWALTLVNAVTGSLLGGVVCVLVVPELLPSLKGPGGRSLAALGGAAIVPFLIPLAPRLAGQLIEWFAKNKFGITVTTREPRGGDDERNP